ncbi:hypothetical protein Vadar_027133 [Vaccinium darrowii]|uniref:Uncharacterized protein n=1 Tax=Vaccinium darrowii TaxID=229202 RepID=A0ACB7XUE6_9ERIC|nr:hypothetical protein Vadar_027133 [Vaccinium darrowii]
MGRGRSKRKANQNTTTAVTVTDLPNHIICDILSRLPLNSIFTCKRVCKIWRDLTLDPYFAKLHLSRSPLSIITYCNGTNTNNNSPSSSHFEIFLLDDPPVISRPLSTMKFTAEIDFPYFGIQKVASCNGLILLSNYSSEGDLVITVCNPLRGQHIVLPKPPKSPSHLYNLELGHNPATDQYKVLRLSHTYHPTRLYIDIYTIGIDDEWRSIRDMGQPPAFIFPNFVFLNGALHCIGHENVRFIYSFDIEKEQFGSFPLPSHFGDSFEFLGVVDNRLCIYSEYSLHGWEIWSMNKYGDFGSWTLEWVIDGPNACGFDGCFKPLKMLKDGSLLIMFSNSRSEIKGKKTTLASYNPQTQVLKKIKYRGTLPWRTSVACVPCFFSPMDALK